jgi:hypothetical protein
VRDVCLLRRTARVPSNLNISVTLRAESAKSFASSSKLARLGNRVLRPTRGHRPALQWRRSVQRVEYWCSKLGALEKPSVAVLDPRAIRTFFAVCRENSISGAAWTLNISHPSVSGAISRLEHQLGATLFEGSRTGIRPTPAGVAQPQLTSAAGEWQGTPGE